MKPHSTSKIDFEKYPHKVIKGLHDLRNNMFHVNHDRFKRQLDALKPDDMLNYFVQFVDAMEDMNVLLKRDGRVKAKPEALAIANAFR